MEARLHAKTAEVIIVIRDAVDGVDRSIKFRYDRREILRSGHSLIGASEEDLSLLIDDDLRFDHRADLVERGVTLLIDILDSGDDIHIVSLKDLVGDLADLSFVVESPLDDAAGVAEAREVV